MSALQAVTEFEENSTSTIEDKVAANLARSQQDA
jgi:hypothetical protein